MKLIWVKDKLEKLVCEYPLRGSDPLLAQELGVSLSAMLDKAWKLKLRFLGRRKNKLGINWRYFDTWSNNMAWTLGYTFADGCVRSHVRVSSLEYGCKLDDIELLEIVKRELESEHKISDHYKDLPNGQKKATLSIGCKNLVDRIQELHGVLPRKSYKDIPYPFVPDDFLGHFARGVLDGDGSVIPLNNGRRVSFRWIGSYLFMKGLMEHLSFIVDIPEANVRRISRVLFRFEWGGKEEVVRLYHLIYPEGEYPYLGRKREKAEKILRNQGLI